jgi:hypothetical protein
MKVPVESDIIVNFGVAFDTFVISRLKAVEQIMCSVACDTKLFFNILCQI